MAFVKAFVSEQDVEKYDLDNLWNKYYTYGRRMPERRTVRQPPCHDWVIDRDRDIWLLPLDVIMNTTGNTPSGLDEPTGIYMFLLYLQGEYIEIHLSKAKGSSVYFRETPFLLIWQLDYIHPASLPNITSAQLLTIIKEILMAYGDSGMHSFVENPVVKFTF